MVELFQYIGCLNFSSGQSFLCLYNSESINLGCMYVCMKFEDEWILKLIIIYRIWLWMAPPPPEMTGWGAYIHELAVLSIYLSHWNVMEGCWVLLASVNRWWNDEIFCCYSMEVVCIVIVITVCKLWWGIFRTQIHWNGKIERYIVYETRVVNEKLKSQRQRRPLHPASGFEMAEMGHGNSLDWLLWSKGHVTFLSVLLKPLFKYNPRVSRSSGTLLYINY